MDLGWCLRPILVPMRLIGVDLISWNHPSGRWQLIMTIYSFIWLLINLINQACVISELSHLYSQGLQKLMAHNGSDALYDWVVLVDYTNGAVNNLINHLIMFTLRREWGPFIDTFCQSVAELSSYCKLIIRKRAIISLVVLFFKVYSFVSVLELGLISCKHCILQIMVLFASYIFEHYVMLSDVDISISMWDSLLTLYCGFGMALYYVISFSIVMMFKILREKIKQLSCCPENKIFARLNQCKNQHVSILNLIHNLEACFGVLLLVEISSKFLEVITGGFYMYLNWIANEFEFTDGLALLLPAIEMFIICYVTHQIQTEVGLFLLSHSFD